MLSALLPSHLRIFRPTIATMMMLAAAAWLPARPLPRKAVHLRLGGPVMTDSDLDMDLLSSRIRKSVRSCPPKDGNPQPTIATR